MNRRSRVVCQIVLACLGLAAAPALHAAAPVSDDFHATALNTSLWTFTNPAGNASYSMSGTNLLLTVPAGSVHDSWPTNKNAALMLQTITNVDFTVEAKFDAKPTQSSQFTGIYIAQDNNNWLRLDAGYSPAGGTSSRLFCASFVNNAYTTRCDTTISLPGSSFWLRVARAGNVWTLYWSPDGTTFTQAATFTQAYTIAKAGVFVGNYNATAANTPAFTSSVDYFFNTASPISPEDGGAATAPDLTVTKSHSGNFQQGGTGTYTLTVQNAGTAATSGTATLTDTLPTGLTPATATGTGWTCGIASQVVTCTRSDALAASASYPAVTLTVNVAANAASSVTNTATVSGGGETNTANDSASDPTTITAASTGGPVSDDFHATALNTSLWTFTNPAGNASYSMSGTNLLLTVPAGSVHDSWPTNKNAALMLQTISNVDFTVEAKFDAKPTQSSQFTGIYIAQDSNNWLRLDVGYSSAGGTSSRLFCASFVSNTPTTRCDTTISLTGSSFWLRVARAGNVWTLYWSADGTTFTQAASFTQAYTIAKAGVFVGNYNATAANTPAFTSSVDYFFNTASPISPEDGGAGTTPDLTVTKTHSGNFQRGGTGTYALTVQNAGTAATSGTVTLTDTLPTGLTPATATGTGWTCGVASQVVTCTRSDALAASSSYPAVTLTVNVAANAASSVTNTAAVSGGGETNTANDSASDATTITAASTPDLTVTKSHSGNFQQSGTGTYTLTVQNAGTAATSGTVTLTDTLPTGLTPASASGTGWTCGIASQVVTCTRSDALAASTSYPAVALTVNVAANAASSVTNTATVSGGGETNTANDSASDPTTITAASSGGPVSDDFFASTLNTTLWTFVNPLGDGSYLMTGTHLLLTVPSGTSHDPWTGTNGAVRMMQPISNIDFQVEVKFDSMVTQQYQMQGVLAEQDASNYVRFDVFNDGSSVHIFGASIIGGTGSTRINSTLSGVTSPFWMRVGRVGNVWTQSWSTNGTTFTTAGSFTQALTIAKVGPFAGNNTPAPAFTASVDYFFNTASPISAEDGGTGATEITLLSVAPAQTGAAIAWTTDRATTSQVRYGTTASYGSTSTLNNTLVTSHTAALAGLACGTLYHYSVTSADTGGTNAVSSPDATFSTTSCNTTGAVISDDFTSATLSSAWTFVNPLGDGSYTLNGSSLSLTVPAGQSHDVWTAGNQSTRVMQPIADADFEVEARFSSVPTTPYQTQGIIVEQDSSNYLRFDVHSATCQTRVFVASFAAGSPSIQVDQPVRGGVFVYLRVKRVSTNWSFSYSYDGTHWTPAFTFTRSGFQVTKIGPFAANAQYNGGSAPAFTAIVDHFINRAAPPSTLDGLSYPPAPAPPVINVWYGDTQTFGKNGIPQQWINILGDVSDFDGISTLTYSLNGGAEQTLWMGENKVRLVEPGDFNAEIDYASLSAGANTVRFTATDAKGQQTVRTVTVNYIAGVTWPSNYTIDWSQVTDISSVAQIVDGKWQIQPDGTVRTMQTGYDRLIALGDRNTWKQYEVSAEITMNSLSCHDHTIGVVVGWQGHTTVQYGQVLPDQPRTGHPFPGLAQYYKGTPADTPKLNIWENTATNPEFAIAEDTSGRQLQLGVKYIFKFRTTTNATGGSHYSMKVWPASGTEPTAWDLQADGDATQGSVVLGAHQGDISFGKITVTGL